MTLLVILTTKMSLKPTNRYVGWLTRLRFSVENVYYSEAEAEAAWWQSVGMDPETVFGDEVGRL